MARNQETSLPVCVTLVSAFCLVISVGFSPIQGSEFVSRLNNDESVPSSLLRYDVHAAYKQALAEDDEKFVEELISYFRRGEEEIDLPDDEREIVLALGLSGVGKSTLALITAGNSDNPLTVTCSSSNGRCFITDELGLISNQSTISETFLPNLILEEDHIPHTAFYDCPGFDDNRNESVEIANSFFMNKVAEHGRKIKILFVVLDATMDASFKDEFPKALRHIISFIKNVEHFSNGFALVGNKMSNRDFTEEMVINGYRDFLNNVYRDIDNYDWSEREKSAGKSVIDSLRGNDWESARMSYFPTPSPVNINGSIDNYPNLRDGRIRVKDFIWNETEYIIPRGDDFGFSFSEKAGYKLNIAVSGISNRIEQEFQKIWEKVRDDFNAEILKMQDGSANTTDLQTRIKSFLEVQFPDRGDQWNITEYMEIVFAKIRSFTSGEEEQFIQNLSKYAEYLNFIHKISSDYTDPLNSTDWFAQLGGYQTTVRTQLTIAVSEIGRKFGVEFQRIWENVRDDFNAEIIKMQNDTANTTDLLTRIKSFLEVQFPDRDDQWDITGYMEIVFSKIRSFTSGEEEQFIQNISNYAEYLDFINKISSGFTDPVNPTDWFAQLGGYQTAVRTQLTIAVSEIGSKFGVQFQRIWENVRDDFNAEIIKMQYGTANTTDLLTRIKSFLEVQFPDRDDQWDITGYMEIVFSKLRSFTSGEEEQFIQNISNYAEYLDFINKISSGFTDPVNPTDWFAQLVGYQTAVRTQLTIAVSDIGKRIEGEFQEIWKNVRDDFNAEIIKMQNDTANTTDLLTRIKSFLEVQFPDRDDQWDITEYMEIVFSKIRSFTSGEVELFIQNISNYAEYLNFIQKISSDYTDPVIPTDWFSQLGGYQTAVTSQMKTTIQALNTNVNAVCSTTSMAVTTEFNNDFAKILEDESVIDPLYARVENLSNAQYPTPQGVDWNMTQYMEWIKLTVATFSASQSEPLSKLLTVGAYLDILLVVEGHRNDLHTVFWMQHFEGMLGEISKHVTSTIGLQLRDIVYGTMENISMPIFKEIADISDDKTDIQEQEDVIEVNRVISSNIVQRINEKLYEPNLKFVSFVTTYITLYEILPGVANFQPLRDILKVIKLVESVGWGDWPVGLNWVKPAENLTNYLSDEIEITRFLKSLFSELGAVAVQVTRTYQLHDWRSRFPDINTENIRDFWYTFKDSDITAVKLGNEEKIIHHLLNLGHGLKKLNQLLSYTLLTSPTCPSAVNDVVLFNKTYLAISDVQKCLEEKGVPSKVVILSQQTIFMDRSLELTGLSFSSTSNTTTVFLLSPVWNHVASGTKISLVGQDGKAPPSRKPENDGSKGITGTNGGDGSNFIGIYRDVSAPPNVETCGGDSGDGQDGAHGRNGENGENSVVWKFDGNGWVSTSECDATNDGRDGNIIVKNAPHGFECSARGAKYPSRCYADDEGVSITLNGGPGVPGGAGGAGGASGIPGVGGNVALVQIQQTYVTYSVGSRGAVGGKGEDGQKGQDGSAGSSVTYSIDDRHHSGSGEKRCQRYTSKTGEATNFRQPRQLSYNVVPEIPKIRVTSGSCSKTEVSQGITIAGFETYVTMFRTTSQEGLRNVFVNRQVLAFLDLMDGNAYLKSVSV